LPIFPGRLGGYEAQGLSRTLNNFQEVIKPLLDLVSANNFGTSQDEPHYPDEPRQPRGFSFGFFSTVHFWVIWDKKMGFSQPTSVSVEFFKIPVIAFAHSNQSAGASAVLKTLD